MCHEASNKGVALGQLGEYDQAINCYTKALEINPNDASAWRNKGIALSKLRKDKAAEEHFARAKRLEAEKKSMM